MDGRAAAKSGWHKSRRWYSQSSSCGNATSERQSQGSETREEAEKTREKDGEKITLCVDLTGTHITDAAEPVEKRRWQEELDKVVEGEEWKQKGSGRPRQGAFAHDEDEDGVHGGRMKPLASFDVNRSLPPGQGKKLRVKLSPTNRNPVSTMVGAAPRAIRRAQDKENGGLVPLCPGTTQIRGVKRKAVSPKDVKHQGKKRIRAEIGTGNALHLSKKGPAENRPSSAGTGEGDNSNGMDLLLMALNAAEPKCQRSHSPAIARSMILQDMNAAERPPRQSPSERAVQKKVRPTSSVAGMMPHRSRPPVQLSPAQRNGQPEGSAVEQANKGCSNERVEKIANHPRPCPVAPSMVSSDKSEKRLEARKENKEESSDSDTSLYSTDDELEKYIRRPHRYVVSTAEHADQLKAKFKASGRKEPVITIIDKNGARTVQCVPGPPKEASEQRIRQPEESRVEQANKGCNDEHVEKIATHPQPCPVAPSIEALDKSEKGLEARKENKEESSDSDTSSLYSTDDELEKFIRRPHRYMVMTAEHTKELSQEYEARNGCKGDPSCSNDGLDKYAMKPLRCRPAPSKPSLDGNKRECEAREKEPVEPSCSEDDLDKYALKPHQYRPAASKQALVNEDQDEKRPECKAMEKEQAEPSYSNDDLDIYAMKVHRYRPAPPKQPMEEKKLECEAMEKEQAEPSDSDDDPEKYAMQVQRYRQAQFKQPLKEKKREYEIKEKEQAEPSCSDDDLDKYGRKPHRYQPAASVETVDGKMRQFEARTKQKGELSCGPLQNSKRATHQGATHNPTRKESPALAESVSHQQPCNSKKRKASDHMSAFCFIPKQLKLANASSLVEAGVASYPSVGPVVVECLAPSTEQKEQHRIAVCNSAMRKALASYKSSQQAIFKSSKEAGKGGADKETCVSGQDRTDALVTVAQEQKEPTALSSTGGGDTSTKAKISEEYQSSKQFAQNREDIASNREVKANSTRISIVARGHESSSIIPASMFSARIDGRSTLEGTFAKNPLLLAPSSRTHLTHADLKPSRSAAVQCTGASFAEDKRSSALGGGLETCRHYNEDNATHHEIAGITVQRRSWEALKAAEFLAKRESAPKTLQTCGINIPLIPSRFHDANDQRVANSEPSFGTHFSHARRGSVCVTTETVQKAFRQRRGPRQGQHEKLSTKVLNKSLENFVQLKVAGCPSGTGFSQLTQIQSGFRANRCNNSLAPRTYSGVPKVPPSKTRQRRVNNKQLEKQKLKYTIAKTNTIANKFKPLAEPCGLLGDFNPGIIRVRNSGQIRAILEALIGAVSSREASELTPSISFIPREVQKRGQDSACVNVETEGGREVKENSLEGQASLPEENFFSQAETNESQPLAASGTRCADEPVLPQILKMELPEKGEGSKFNGEELRGPVAGNANAHQRHSEVDSLASPNCEAMNNSDCLHEQSETITQKLSTVSVDPESKEEDNEQDMQPTSGTSSSPAAAGLAGRWLELLTLDIEGRLSALKRSRGRVRSTLLSAQLDPESRSSSVVPFNPASTSCCVDVDALGSQQSVCSDATTTQARQDDFSQGLDRWRDLFTNMDCVLGKEAAKLESWLWQIQQMQAFCPGPNQQPFSIPQTSHLADCNGVAASTLGIENQPPHRCPLSMEATEKELGLAASAASILSTANFVTKLQSFDRQKC